MSLSCTEYCAPKDRRKTTTNRTARILPDRCNSQVLAFIPGGSGGGGSKGGGFTKQLVVMDEVDGMGGSDRGGIQELILLIKKSKVPIMAICNDRQHQKIRRGFPFTLFFPLCMCIMRC